MEELRVNPVLVTGSTGLVGNNVVRMLLEQGRSVRVIVRQPVAPEPLTGLDIEIFHGDIRNADAVQKAVEGTSGIIHTAGYVRIGWANWDLYHSINVVGTRVVAAAAREAGVKLVHVSSCDALPVRTIAEPVDEDTIVPYHNEVPYAKSKRLAEEEVMDEIQRGLNAVIANPAFMLGPWDWKPSSGQMLLAVARGKALFAPHGWFSLCDVRDVAEGILVALERGPVGRRYILAGETYSYLEAWRIFAEVTGGRKPWFRTGPLVVLIGGRGGDLLARLTGREPQINSAAFFMARLPKCYSSERARTELGYRIRPTRETVSDAWNWFQQHGFDKRMTRPD